MKKLVGMFLALTMLLSLACPVASLAENEPVTVQFWNGWTGSDGDVLMEMVDQFNETNPYNITIEMDINAQFQEKIAGAFANKTAPALILAANNYKDIYAGQLQPMDDLFEQTSLKREDFIAGYMDSCSTNGALYVLPFQVTARYLYWNKDLFAAAGLDPEAPPTSFAQWTEMAAKITNPDANVYGSGLSYNNAVTNLAIMQRMGGLFVDYDAENKLAPRLEGNAGYIKFLNWMKDLIDSGNNPMETDTGSMFKAGLIGITTDGAWLNAGLGEVPFQYGVALMPYDDAGKCMPTSCSGFAVTMTATDAEKLAAYRFIEWWFNGDANTETTGALRWSLDCGFPGFYKPAIADARYQASERLSAMTSSDDEVDTTFMAPSEFAQTFLMCNEVLEVAIESVVVNGVSPEEALATAQAAAQTIVDAN